MAQHLAHLRAAEPFLKPVYQHKDGTFGPLVRVEPKRFSVVEGLLGYYTEELRQLFDVRVYLAPPEELRRKLEGAARLLAARLHDRPGAERARPARARLGGVHPARSSAYADIVVSFLPNAGGDQEHLDAELVLRPTLQPPRLPLGARRRGRRRAAGSASARRATSRTSTSPGGSSASGPR